MIRTRIAPSPTGLFHIGTLRTALFNYLYAKKHNGKFIIRIEDTDKERSLIEFEENIISGLHKIGLTPDEGPLTGGEFGPYRQSERTEIYKKYLQQLLDQGDAYYCYCTKEELDREREECMKKKLPPRYSGKCRSLNEEEKTSALSRNQKPVIRLKVPENTEIAYNDLIRGDQSQNTKDLTGDFVIAKNLDTPLYNFTVVIDDHLMKISHVMRGEDHISNTPKQILMYKALNFEIPKFAHFPLILNPDKTKLSKRKNAVSVQEYLDQGYTESGLINFLALLGWNPGTEEEIFTLVELIQAFSIDRIHKSGAVFDIERLKWINGAHIKNMDLTEFTKKTIPYLEKAKYIQKPLISDMESNFEIVDTKEIINFEKLSQLVSFEQNRIKLLSEISENLGFFFVDQLSYEVELLCGKKLDLVKALFALEESLPVLEEDTEFTVESMKENLIKLIEKLGVKNGEILWPLRVALTGQARSIGAFEAAFCLGKEKTMERLEKAIYLIKKS